MLRFHNHRLLSGWASALQGNTEAACQILCSGLTLGQAAFRSKEVQCTKRLISSCGGTSLSQPFYKDDREVMPGRRKKPQTLWTGGLKNDQYWYRPEWIKAVQELPETLPSGPGGTSINGAEKDSHRALPILRIIEALGRISSSTESVTHDEMLDHVQIVIQRMAEYSEHEQREFLRRMRVMLSRKRNKALLAAMPMHSPIQGAIQEALQPFVHEWKEGKNVAAWTSLARIVGTLQWHNPSFLAESLTPDTVLEFDPFALSVAIAEVVRCRVNLPQDIWRALLLAIRDSCDPRVPDLSANDKDIVSYYKFLAIIRPATCELVGLNAISTFTSDDETDNRGFKPESYVWIVDELPEELWSETLQTVEEGMSLDEEGAAKMRMKMIQNASTDVVLSLHAAQDVGHAPM